MASYKRQAYQEYHSPFHHDDQKALFDIFILFWVAVGEALTKKPQLAG